MTHKNLAVQLGEIVAVQRLAKLEHYVVRYIDHWVDGAQTCTSQPLGQPDR